MDFDDIVFEAPVVALQGETLIDLLDQVGDGRVVLEREAEDDAYIGEGVASDDETQSENVSLHHGLDVGTAQCVPVMDLSLSRSPGVVDNCEMEFLWCRCAGMRGKTDSRTKNPVRLAWDYLGQLQEKESTLHDAFEILAAPSACRDC